MIEERDKIVDRDLSEAYRAGSVEKAPEALNRRVLREAAAPARSRRMGALNTWYRPLAFAATLVIGVALIYDMQTALRESDSPAVPLPQSIESRADSGTPPTDTRADTLVPIAKPSTAKSTAESRRELPASGAAKPAASMSKIRVAPAAPGENELESQTRQRNFMDAQPESAARAANARSETIDSTAARSALIAEPETDACSSQFRDSAEQWWQCVQQLRSNGDSNTADDELERLKARYPDFTASK